MELEDIMRGSPVQYFIRKYLKPLMVLQAHHLVMGIFFKPLSSSVNFNLLNCVLNRGSYMSAHVLLNLLNELGKRDKMRGFPSILDKMRGFPSILSLFRNEFNKFNNTRARMLDSIYHMTNTLKSHFWRKNVILLPLCRNFVMDVITFPVNL